MRESGFQVSGGCDSGKEERQIRTEYSGGTWMDLETVGDRAIGHVCPDWWAEAGTEPWGLALRFITQ